MEKKELSLEVLRRYENLISMRKECSQLLKKYPNDKVLINLREQALIYLDTETIKGNDIQDLIKLENSLSKDDFKNYLKREEEKLLEINNWLSKGAKEYIKNNFEQKELKCYWFKELPKSSPKE